MSTFGVLYHSDWDRSYKTTWLDLPEVSRGRRALYFWRYDPKVEKTRPPMRMLANLLFLLGFSGALLTMLPVAAIEMEYRLSQLTANSLRLTAKPVVIDSNLSLITPTPEPGPKDEMEAFSVDIPKIGAKSVVIPNVDASDPAKYMPALQKGVAHAAGTGLPGVDNPINRTIYLFAHSTSAPWFVAKYNAQFYLLNKMEVGDEITVTFWAKEYKYRVREVKTVPARDTTVFEPQTKEELLVLATCTPPGTTWNRLLVIASRE